MSEEVSWYPRTAKERKSFFWRSFPMFVVLIVFLYFGLDWIGAFEFLEIMVRDNSSWLLQVIWGYDSSDIVAAYFQRVDQDPLKPGNVFFGQPYFPGIDLATYPRILLIIRACTGMEAGALLMALILVTPAKWQKKLGATVTNFLMMHIGNTFRVAFHFWYTQHLYVKYIDLGMASDAAADKAFFLAHDSLSKVFGFVGIVIFTLVIERQGVRIVSTFGAWIDSFVDSMQRVTKKVETNAYYFKARVSYEELAQADETIPSRVETIDKINYYPRQEIENNKWKFFTNTFVVFALIAGGLAIIGLIPQINQGIGASSDALALKMGARFDERTKLGTFWWLSVVENVNQRNFVISILTSGVLVFSLMMAGILVTPASWKNRGIAMAITPVIIFPLNILHLGFNKWATWKVANGPFENNRPLLYLNLADIVKVWIPLFFWVGVVILLLYLYKKLQVNFFAVIWAWLHQITFTLGWLIGIKERPGAKKKEEQAEVSDANASK
ncbi:MAG: hypothetical protein K9W42_09690 [Candidatus Heimdallarchaeota archaeon]|nr:hypothetical protein [Candidatus Heimdallarchaeota archaeon]